MKFLENWKRKRIVTRIVKRLPFQLAQRYGGDRYYTAAQIERILNEENYRNAYRGYAFVFAMNPSSAATHLGSDEVVTQMREELAAEFFHGNTGFDASLHSLDNMLSSEASAMAFFLQTGIIDISSAHQWAGGYIKSLTEPDWKLVALSTESDLAEALSLLNELGALADPRDVSILILGQLKDEIESNRLHPVNAMEVLEG